MRAPIFVTLDGIVIEVSWLLWNAPQETPPPKPPISVTLEGMIIEAS